MNGAVLGDKSSKGLYMPFSVLRAIRRSSSSPLWLRIWALAALSADESGRAAFGATELVSMLRRPCDKSDLTIEQIESAMHRARSLGLISEHVGTTSFTLGGGIALVGVEAST